MRWPTMSECTWQRGQKSLSGLSFDVECVSLKPTGSTTCLSQSVRGQAPNSCALYLAFCRPKAGKVSEAFGEG